MFHITETAVQQLRRHLAGATVVAVIAAGGGREPDVLRGLTIATAADELSIWIRSGATFAGTEGGWIKFAAGDASISFWKVC